MSIAINLNSEIRVKLNAKGREIYKKRYGKTAKADMDGMTVIHMCDFINTFGGSFSTQTCITPLENMVIQIEPSTPARAHP